MKVDIGGIPYLIDPSEWAAKNTGESYSKEKVGKDKVTFNEEAHSYTNDRNGKKYISATTIIGKFKQPFDKVAVSTAYAKKHGNTPEYWQKEWSKISKVACDKGTLFHKRKEQEGIDKGYAVQDKKIIPVHVAEDLAKIDHDYRDIPDGVHQELLMWNNYFELAGIADIITIDGNYFDIDDYKTNKKIDKFSFCHPKTGYKKMMFPLQHLQDCNFNHYQLQLSIYAFMLEQLSGKKCRSICFHHHPPKADDPSQAQEEGIRYDVKYLKKEVLDMLAVYTKKDISQFK
jgi:hypothetical protein